MKITVEQLSKRFNREKIFAGLDYTFCPGQKYVITGANGSGKSTLLQLISGAILPSAGTINYWHDHNAIDAESIYRFIAYAAPYMEVMEEFTLLEQLKLHFKFKNLHPGEQVDSIIRKAYFQGQEHKPIRNFSSGMKQRLKLAMAFFAETPVLLLDEPTTNLDEEGIAWYREQIHLQRDRLVILASNSTVEFPENADKLSIGDYK